MIEKNQLDSTCGISDDELTRRFEESIRIDEEFKRVKGTPVEQYDAKEKKACVLDVVCSRTGINTKYTNKSKIKTYI